MTDPYLPNELLSRLAGDRLASVQFVVNDYVQLHFDGLPGTGDRPTLNAYAWPVIEADGRAWRESDLGYADAFRRLAPGYVTSTVEQTGMGIRIILETGAVTIHPTVEEAPLEIAELSGFADNASMLWLVGGVSFDDIV